MRYNIQALALFATIVNACGSATPKSEIASERAKDFHSIDVDAIHYSTSNDETFCKNRPASECFTFVLAVPSPELESNLSLGALALSLGSEKFRVPTLRACNKSVDAYVRGYQGRSSTLRAKFFSRIRETRCLIDIVRRETYDPPNLSEGQFGIAFRLVAWDVVGSVNDIKLLPLTFKVQTASLTGAYRNAAIFSRAEGDQISKWHDLYAREFRPLGGLSPLQTRFFSKTFNKQFLARFSTVDSVKTLAETIDRIRNDHLNETKIVKFFDEVTNAVTAIVAGNRTNAAVAMLAIAIDAIKSCQPDDLIKSTLISSNLVDVMREHFGTSEVIDSFSNALFYDSHLILPGKLIDDAFTNANAGQLTKDLDISTEGQEEAPESF